MTVLTFADRLPAALSELDNLPSLPVVALEVLRLTQAEDSTIEELAQCIARDPALAAKILKLSNSSLFNTGQQIGSLERATMMLGLKTVKLMSLSFSLVGSIPKDGVQHGFHFREFWSRSVVRSVAARSLVELVGSRLGDEAYLCGLLSHFGRLVLAQVLRGDYEVVANEGKGWPSCEMEESRLGFSNLDVCAYLLKEWGVPEVIYVAVGYWNRPDEIPADAPPEAREIIEILELADLAERLLCEEDRGDSLRTLEERMELRLGRTPEETREVIVGLESGIAETAEMLALDLPTSIDELMSEARQRMMSVSLGIERDRQQVAADRERLAAENQQLATKATTDMLTGLPNRAAFDEYLELHVARRLAGEVPLALGLAMVDIDHFKKINDTWGHLAGDEVLRRVGGLLTRLTRKGDVAARYGGEEFAVIAPQTNPFNIRTMCERLRAAIEAETIEFGGQSLKVTASFGAACIAKFDAPEDAQALIKLADSCLYRAKATDRNRTETYKKIAFPGR